MKLSGDADQVEFESLVHGVAGLPPGVEEDVLARTVTDDDMGAAYANEETWMYDERATGSAASGVLEEIQLRLSTLKSMYPFHLRRGALEYVGGDSCLYEFLLCASLGYNSYKGSQTAIPRLFERVTTELTANILGKNVNYVHLGWPNSAKGFKKAHEPVFIGSQELKWAPAPDLSPDGPSVGDQGVDYIIWKGYGCGRSTGQLFFAGQCACGNNWESKLGDVSKQYWHWFQSLAVNPVSVFAVPHILPEAKITEVSRRAGVVLDRIRLVIAGQHREVYNENKWNAEMITVISNVKTG